MEILELNEMAGLKIVTADVTTNLLSIIRKYRNDSIFKIRNDILNNEFVLSCNYIEDDTKLKQLIKCYDELKKHNYEIEVYFAGKKENIQVIRNWAQTSDEISNEGWEDLDS